MHLLPSADRVVRHVLPAAFDAAGAPAESAALRDLERLSCHRTALAAATALKSAHRRLRGSPGSVRTATFWCEKAVWAAAQSDAGSFTRCVDMAHAAIREDMSSRLALN